MRVTSIVNRLKAATRSQIDLLRTLSRGFHNILDLWPSEVFERGLCVYKVIRRQVFVVSDPALIEYVMLTNVENFRKSDASRQMLEPLIGQSMFITHGDHWRRQRRIATPAFHTRHIRRFVDTMVAQTLAMLERWEEGDPRAEVELGREMTQLTAEIICHTLFGHDIGGSVDQVYDAFSRYQDSLGRLALAELTGLPSWLPRLRSRRGSKAVSELDAIVTNIIDSRRASHSERRDLLGLLLSAVDPETGAHLSDRLIRDELLFLFLAGHETTANALIWSWYLLSQSQEAEQRLHAEIDSVLGARVPCYEDLENLPWLRAVLQESMRLYPPVHVYSREAVNDDWLGDQRCPAGAMVVVSPWVVHRHRALWDEPDAFRPERFLPENARGRSRYSWIPFGAGPRICLGMGFAMTEMMIAMALVAQRYRLCLAPGQSVEPLGRLTLRPSQEIRMVLGRRSRKSGAAL